MRRDRLPTAQCEREVTSVGVVMGRFLRVKLRIRRLSRRYPRIVSSIRSFMIFSATFGGAYGFIIGSRSENSGYDPNSFAIGASFLFAIACAALAGLSMRLRWMRKRMRKIILHNEALADRNWELKEAEERALAVARRIRTGTLGVNGGAWFGPDAPTMIDMLSATSPNQTVPGNVTVSLNQYKNLKTGQPFTGMPAVKGMLEKSAAGQPFGGLKVSSFKKNLMGDPLPVTVDRWISRIFGFGDSPTQAQYKFMDYLITQTAKDKGIPPREYQAAIWAAVRDAMETTGASGASFEQIMRDKFAQDPELMRNIKMWQTMANPPRPRPAP